jgi:hypothetical protein
MTDLPERIWAVGRPGVQLSRWWHDREIGYATAYVRADLHTVEQEAHAETQAALRSFIADLDAANARAEAAEAEAHACGAEREAWKERAEATWEMALREAAEQVADRSVARIKRDILDLINKGADK